MPGWPSLHPGILPGRWLPVPPQFIGPGPNRPGCARPQCAACRLHLSSPHYHVTFAREEDVVILSVRTGKAGSFYSTNSKTPLPARTTDAQKLDQQKVILLRLIKLRLASLSLAVPKTKRV
jgi:hypothetical protein